VGQSMARLCRVGQAWQGNARQGIAGHGEQGMAGHGEQGMAGQGKARQVNSRQGKTGQGKAWLGRAGQVVRSLQNMAWRDMLVRARHVKVREGKAR
jgi:hypothetical protein